MTEQETKRNRVTQTSAERIVSGLKNLATMREVVRSLVETDRDAAQILSDKLIAALSEGQPA